jgi:hypothetical protein
MHADAAAPPVKLDTRVPIRPRRPSVTDRLLTVDALRGATTAAPALVDVRRLERHLVARLAELDRRVDDLLAFGGLPLLEAAAQIDVLCAAIVEAEELLVETRAEAARQLRRHAARRSGRRRWS